MDNWKITKDEEHWVDLDDPEGWYSASMKWDGCVHFYRYFNESKSKDSKSEDINYIHICDLEDFIKRLQELLEYGKGKWPEEY